MRRVMLFNESGIGNAVLALPVLDSFNRSSSVESLYAVDSAFFASGLFNEGALPKLRLRFPKSWRRFGVGCHERIAGFMRQFHINTVVNLRNESKQDDAEYFVFAAACRNRHSGTEFWDLHEALPVTRREAYIQSRWAAMLRTRELSMDEDFTRHYLTSVVPPKSCMHHSPSRRVGLYLGGGRIHKRMHPSVSARIAAAVIEEYAMTVEVQTGISHLERAEAASAVASIPATQRGKAALLPSCSLAELLAWLSRLTLLVSHDTAAMHLAVGLGVPTVGIFITTASSVWGGPDRHDFCGVMSGVCESCPHMPQQGTCLEICNGKCIGDPRECIDVTRVAASVGALLGNRQSGARG